MDILIVLLAMLMILTKSPDRLGLEAQIGQHCGLDLERTVLVWGQAVVTSLVTQPHAC